MPMLICLEKKETMRRKCEPAYQKGEKQGGGGGKVWLSMQVTPLAVSECVLSM